MNIKSHLAALAVCTLPMLAHAGVIYEWTAANDLAPQGMTLQLEFDKKTVEQGYFKLDLAYDYTQGYGSIPKHGLLGLFVSLPGVSYDIAYSSKGGRGYTFPWGYVEMNVAFMTDGFLTGSIYANDQYSHIRLASIGHTVTVTDTNSDELEHGLSGATGYIQRVAEIPEPASMALFALGAVGLTSTRRRKSVT